MRVAMFTVGLLLVSPSFAQGVSTGSQTTMSGIWACGGTGCGTGSAGVVISAGPTTKLDRAWQICLQHEKASDGNHRWPYEWRDCDRIDKMVTADLEASEKTADDKDKTFVTSVANGATK